MKVLFDTDIILDVLLDREPFADNAAYLLSKVERSEIIGFVCATTITTIILSLKHLVPKRPPGILNPYFLYFSLHL